MEIRTLANCDIFRRPILTDQYGLPLVFASLWLSMNETRFAENTIRKKLRSIAAFYKHVRQDRYRDLDQILAGLNIDEINDCLRSYLAKSQNNGYQSQSDRSRDCVRVIEFIIETTEEYAVRGQLPYIDTQKIAKETAKLRSLYKFLRPQKDLKVYKIRSIPGDVLKEVFEIVTPSSNLNPFRTLALQQRNYVIVMLLFFLGLRKQTLSMQNFPLRTIVQSFGLTLNNQHNMIPE